MAALEALIPERLRDDYDEDYGEGPDGTHVDLLGTLRAAEDTWAAFKVRIEGEGMGFGERLLLVVAAPGAEGHQLLALALGETLTVPDSTDETALESFDSSTRTKSVWPAYRERSIRIWRRYSAK